MIDLLERAKASLVGVTQGPWEARRAKPMHDAHTTLWHVVGPEKAHICGTGRLDDVPKADAEFIASARELVPELIAEVERLRESEDTADKAIDLMLEREDRTCKLLDPGEERVEEVLAIRGECTRGRTVAELRAEIQRLQKLVDAAREDGWQEGAASVRAVVQRRLGPLGSK